MTYSSLYAKYFSSYDFPGVYAQKLRDSYGQGCDAPSSNWIASDWRCNTKTKGKERGRDFYVTWVNKCQNNNNGAIVAPLGGYFMNNPKENMKMAITASCHEHEWAALWQWERSYKRR